MLMSIFTFVPARFGLAISPMHNKTAMKSTALASAAVLALLGASFDAQAVALGAVKVNSALGEPLRAEIEVPQISSEEAASFQAAVASPQAFRTAGVEYTSALAGARVSLHRRPNGQAYLRLISDRPVNEPFLGVVIEAHWATGSIVRDYTMLVDPPGRAAPAPVAVTAPQATPPVQTAPSVSAAPRQPLPRPAEAARPVRRAEPAAPAGDGAQVTVQRGDTAYGIVSTHAVDGVSLDQMLIALLRANPGAFIGGNVNRMRAGAVLDLPTAEQANAVPRQTARRQVLAQARDFNDYRRGIAQNVRGTQAEAAGRSTSGGVQAQVRESAAPAPTQDRLTLSRSGAPAGAESAAAQSRQAKEQAERVAELNKNISELSKLQSASGTAPAAPAASAPGISVPAPAPVVAATTAAPAASATAPASAPAEAAASGAEAAAAAASAATAAASAAETAASAPAPVASAPKKAPAPPPAPMAEPSFLDTLTENPLLPIAGVGLIALLAGYGVYRSRQRKKEAAPLDSSFIESRLQPDSFFGASGGQRVNTREGAATGSSSMAYSPSQLDAAGDVDPVAEADVYLAYGRDMQAEEILKEALHTHPGRIAIHRKLAEIYAKRRDARALEAIAADAYDVTHGEGPDWLAITALGSELDPDNQLYKPGGAPVARAEPAHAGGSFGADTEPQTAQLLEKKHSSNAPLDLHLDLDDAPVRASAPAPAPAPAPAVVSRPVDLDLGIDFAPPSELGAETRQPATTPPPSPSGMIDFDMAALSVDPDSRSGGDLQTEQSPDADDDPLGTKLALAQEFHAIGDTEGARSLVREVIAEASGSLKARAERFLAELG